MQNDILESLKACSHSINAGECKALVSVVNADQAIPAEGSQEKEVECNTNLSELLEEREMLHTASCTVNVHVGETAVSQ